MILLQKICIVNMFQSRELKRMSRCIGISRMISLIQKEMRYVSEY